MQSLSGTSPLNGDQALQLCLKEIPCLHESKNIFYKVESPGTHGKVDASGSADFFRVRVVRTFDEQLCRQEFMVYPHGDPAPQERMEIRQYITDNFRLPAQETSLTGIKKTTRVTLQGYYEILSFQDFSML